MTRRVSLPDVNILVALLWPGHIHHDTVRAWFPPVREAGWATCPLTEMGAVRVLAAQAVTLGRLSVAGAAEGMNQLAADRYHEFWPADLPLSDPLISAGLPHIQGPRQLTDRYLLALAAAHHGTFVTLDRSVGAGLPGSSPLLRHIEVIEA